MPNKSKKYGNYYGELVNVKDIIEADFFYFGDHRITDIIEYLDDCKVKEAIVDVEEQEDYSATLFFEIDKYTHLEELMVFVTNLRPHEFTRTSEHCYRMWFD